MFQLTRREALGLLMAGAVSAGCRRREEAPTGVGVDLRFSVPVFDPKRPEGFLECVVRNGTGSPIEVPAGYAVGFDTDIVLFGVPLPGKVTVDGDSYWWEMRLVRQSDGREEAAASERAKAPSAVLPPGWEGIVFKEGLNELLLEMKGAHWTWRA